MKKNRVRTGASLPKAETPEQVQALRDMLACQECGARPPDGHGSRSKCPNAAPAPVAKLRG
jgi:hypothetical protein